MRSSAIGKRPLSAVTAASTLLLAALGATPAAAQFATALLRENGPLPGAPAGHSVGSLNNTAVNHAGGYAISVNSSDGVATLSHVWGNAAGGAGSVMITEATYGPFVQTAFESFYGISNSGQVSYSATGTGGPVGNFDSVWLDGAVICMQGAPSSVANQFWSFGSRPGVTADGKPYFVGGLANTAAGSTVNRGLFYGLAASPVILGGQLLPGLPFVLSSTTTNPGFDYRYSALGTHYIAPVLMVSGSSTNDDAMVKDSAGLIVSGSLVREGTLVPVAAGGNGLENWAAFDFMGITESGSWFFTGNTNAAASSNEIIVKDGMIIHREGNIIDGQTIGGDIEGAYMNESGDIAYVWDVSGGLFEALFVNDEMIVLENDSVDLSGDGIVDGNTKLRDFTGISTLTVSDRDGLGDVNVYFTADIDTLGTTSTTDDVEGFFCIKVNVDTPIAVTLTSFELTAVAAGLVKIDWTTADERDHAGFNVYRAEGSADFSRLNDGLVSGDGRYSFTDDTARPGATYAYRLGAVDRSGREELFAPSSIRTPDGSNATALLPNLPNPFAAATEIRFSLGRAGEAALAIFDVNGRIVRALSGGAYPAGDHAVVWDGTDDEGRPAPGGVYFYRLDTPDGTTTRKMIRMVR